MGLRGLGFATWGLGTKVGGLGLGFVGILFRSRRDRWVEGFLKVEAGLPEKNALKHRHEDRNCPTGLPKPYLTKWASPQGQETEKLSLNPKREREREMRRVFRVEGLP